MNTETAWALIGLTAGFAVGYYFGGIPLGIIIAVVLGSVLQDRSAIKRRRSL